MRVSDYWKRWMNPVPEIAVGTFYLRCLWVVIQLVAAYIFAERVSPFFYQQF